MQTYAQTTLQIYRQLTSAGYHDVDLQVVRQCCELNNQLLAGRYRPTGKCLSEHAIGTASILQRHGAAPQLVIAGLLHAAYEFGDFGDGRRGIHPIKRRVLAEIASGAEEVVAVYTQFPWHGEQAAELFRRCGEFSDVERDVALLRIANELEEYVDCGMLFCDKRRQYQDDRNDQMIEAARALGWQSLGDELAVAIEEARQLQVPESLKSERRTSYLQAPASYSRRLWRRLRILPAA